MTTKQTAHNAQMCTSSACRTVTISLLIGAALLICVTVVIIVCCKRGQRKVKKTAINAAMGFFRRSRKAEVESDEEQLRPQQQQQPFQPFQAPMGRSAPVQAVYQPYQPYTQDNSQNYYEAPHESPFPQRQWRSSEKQCNTQTQTRSQQKPERQLTRCNTNPEEDRPQTPAEKWEVRTRGTTAFLSSM